MFNITYNYNFSFSCHLDNESHKTVTLPNDKKIYSIDTQCYKKWIGFLLAIFGQAVKIETKEHQFIYISKNKLLKIVSKDQQKQKEILSKISQISLFCITIKEESLINEFIRNCQIDNHLIKKTETLKENFLNSEIISETLISLKNNLIDETKLNSILSKLEYLISNKDFFQSTSKNTLFNKLSQFIKKDFKNFTYHHELEKLINSFQELLEKSEKKYLTSLSKIEIYLENLSYHPEMIQSATLEQLFVIIELEQKFINLDHVISHLYKTDALSEKFALLNDQLSESASLLENSMVYNSENIVNHLINENNLIELIEHANESLRQVKSQELTVNKRKMNAEIVKQIIERSKILIDHLSIEQLQKMAKTEFRFDTGSYTKVGGIIKEVLKEKDCYKLD